MSQSQAGSQLKRGAARRALLGWSITAMIATALMGCSQEPAATPPEDVRVVTFSQQQAIPDFDDAVYQVDDPAERERLRDLLHRHEVFDDVELRSDCDGSRITTVVWSDEHAVSHWLVVDSCLDDALSVEVTDLVDQWHARGGWPTATP